jgi:PiT family inorganic phosphate transporter
METVGKKITELTNTRGFSIDFSAATVVLVASSLGLPISTTHTVVGAVIGVGLARGVKAINKDIVKDIVISWFVTVPVAAIIAGIVFKILMIVG